MTAKDNIFSDYREKVAGFKFDDSVATVFDDMVRRSVPGYATVIAMTKVFAEHYSQPNSNCYDLGCSLGAGTLAIRHGLDKPGTKIIAVDNSPAMIERCRETIDRDIAKAPVELRKADIRDVPIQNASLVVMNFTLQFFDPENRAQLIKRIHEGLRPGGALLLSEKITFDDHQQQQWQSDMHHDFKRLHGYSDLEISQKRKSLENVLVPDSIETHIDRLETAGFAQTYLWFRCFNFVSIAAIKKK